MTTDTVEAFRSSLDRVNATRSETTVEDFSDVIDAVGDEPAVGAPLSFEGASLPAWVETEPTPSELEAARTGVTPAAFAVADYGSVVLRATPDGVEPASLFPERHVAVMRASDVEPDMPAAFERFGPLLREEGASAIVATGPSATADMGELVYGAHGPQDVHVVVLTDR